MTRSTHAAVPDDRNANVQIYINGEFFARDEAKVSVFDSGFLVGDGIWEGIRLHGGQFAFLDRHLDRLEGAAKATGIDVGTRESVESALRETVVRNDMHDGVHVRLMVTRGDKKTPSQHPSNVIGDPNVVIIAEHKRADPGVADDGITVFTATIRRPPPDTLTWNDGTQSGECTVEKLGPVLVGRAGFTVRPHRAGSRVEWIEDVDMKRLPGLLSKPVALAGAAGFKFGMWRLARQLR